MQELLNIIDRVLLPAQNITGDCIEKLRISQLVHIEMKFSCHLIDLRLDYDKMGLDAFIR